MLPNNDVIIIMIQLNYDTVIHDKTTRKAKEQNTYAKKQKKQKKKEKKEKNKKKIYAKHEKKTKKKVLENYTKILI